MVLKSYLKRFLRRLFGWVIIIHTAFLNDFSGMKPMRTSTISNHLKEECVKYSLTGVMCHKIHFLIKFAYAWKWSLLLKILKFNFWILFYSMRLNMHQAYNYGPYKALQYRHAHVVSFLVVCLWEGEGGWPTKTS